MLLAVEGSIPVAQGSSGIAGGDPGTVDTIAGPGFCRGQTSPDPASGTVRALAVANPGVAFVDTGPPSDGVIAIVNLADLTARAVPAGVPMAPVSAGDDRVQAPVVPSASRLASDGKWSVLAAAGDRVERVGDGRVIAGQPASAGAVHASTGDGGPAEAATFTFVRSISTDPDGGLYVADALDLSSAAFRVRFVNRGETPIVFYPGTSQQIEVAPDTIATIAGGAPDGSPAEDVPARDAGLQGAPPALAIAGNHLYVGTQLPADGTNPPQSRVRVINIGGQASVVHGVEIGAGSIRTVAGGDRSGFAGDNGAALDGSFGAIPGIAVDGAGALYLADWDHHRIRRIDQAGIITTFAGSGGTGPSEGGYGGNGGPAVEARLNHPFDVEAGPDGSVYVSDALNGQVRSVDSNGIIRALPHGFGNASTCSEDPAPNPARRADTPRAAEPQRVVAASDGSLYFTGPGFADVRRVDPEGIVNRAAGSWNDGPCPPWPPGCPTTNDDAAIATRLDRPTALAWTQGGLYLFDSGHRAVRFVNTGASDRRVHGVLVRPKAMKLVAAGKQNALVPDVSGPANEFAEESVLAVDSAGHLFVGDPGAETVWHIDEKGKTRTAIARPSDDGACCGEPLALAVTEGGDLYVLDGKTNRVWFLNRGADTVRVLGQRVPPGELIPVVGSGASGIAGEGGLALAAEMLRPVSIAVGIGGELYVADARANSVRVVDGEGTISTIVGAGNPGFNGDGQRGRLTELNRPTGIAVDRCGNVLIADSGNDRLRRFNVAPSCVSAGQVQTRPTSPAWLLSGATAAILVAGVLWRRRARARAIP